MEIKDQNTKEEEKHNYLLSSSFNSLTISSVRFQIVSLNMPSSSKPRSCSKEMIEFLVFVLKIPSFFTGRIEG